MSIDNKLRQIIQIKSDIKDAIVDKGVEMPAGLPFDQYASKVSEISSGGGEPVIKGYRTFVSTSPCKVEDNILIMDSSSSDSLLHEIFEDPNAGNFTACVKVKMTEITTDKPNLFFGSVNNSFCVGCGANTTKLGVWLYNSGGSRLLGDDTTGQSNYELELDKWYYIRFHYYCYDKRADGAFAFLDIKENLEDNYTNIFTSSKLAGYNLYSTPTPFYYGGSSYGSVGAGRCNIDLSASYMTWVGSNPNRVFQVPFY